MFKDKPNQQQNAFSSMLKNSLSKSRPIGQWFSTMMHYVKTFNIFHSDQLPVDPYDLKTQYISSRVFIAVFSFALIILLVYASVSITNQRTTIKFPSTQDFDQLFVSHSKTLACPCTKISTSYKTFINVTYRLHPICNSIYVTQQWRRYIVGSGNTFYRQDFRLFGIFLFDALESLCQLAEDIIDNSLQQFYSNTYTTAFATSADFLQQQGDTIVRQFMATTTNSFSMSLRMIRDTSQANALQSALMTNYYLIMDSMSYRVYALPNYYDGCSCANSAQCLTDLGISISGSHAWGWNIPGLHLGCYVLEALYLSSLECFYNRTCLDEFDSYIASEIKMNLTTLNMSKSGRFSPSMTMEMMFAQLLVDEWNWTIIHREYYKTCQPAECIYTEEKRRNLASIVTLLVSVVGGLVTGLTLVIPRLIWLVRLIWKPKPRPSSDILFWQKFRRLPYTLHQYLFELNLFRSMPPTADPYQLKTERLSTKIYIVAFIVSLLILLGYTASDSIVSTIIVKTPSIQKYNALVELYSPTLRCDCNEISISYQNFINITYSLHPICKSVYITEHWRRYISDTDEPILSMDFRYMGLFSFQALESLCQLAERSIEDALKQIYFNSYISATVTSLNVFETLMNSIIKQCIATLTNTFLNSLRMIRDSTQANGILSGLLTNYGLASMPYSSIVNSFAFLYDGDCECAYDSACVTRIAIYKNFDILNSWIVPGIYQGCYMIEALRQSNLECFYNQTCLDELATHIMSRITLNLMPVNQQKMTRFLPNTTMGVIIDELLVDQWNWTISHANYYDLCKPKECQYQIVTRHNALNIITIVIGLIGGLVNGLKILVYRSVWILRYLFKQCRKNGSHREQPTQRSMYALFRTLHRHVRDFNFYASADSLNDPQKLRTERISSRVFLLLFLSSLSVLLIYTSAVSNTFTITVTLPHIDEYTKLSNSHPETIACPCTKISTSYKTFINVTYRLHPICNSIYVTRQWRQYISSNATVLNMLDFRFIGIFLFDALESLCQLAEDIVDNSLQQFYSSTYTTAFATSADFLQQQGDTIVRQFIATTTNSFSMSLRMIRDTSQANALQSALMTNYGLLINPNSPVIDSYELMYDNNCRCAFYTSCISQTAIYRNISSRTVVWRVPGIHHGCYVIEALRQSNLECFYNQTCLDELATHIMSRITLNFMPLNQQTMTRFLPNTTMSVIIDELLVDQWNWTISHANYYDICKPKECQYQIVTRHNALNIITIVIGLIGGLITAVKMISRFAVLFVMKLVQMKRKNRIQPSEEMNRQQSKKAEEIQVDNGKPL